MRVYRFSIFLALVLFFVFGSVAWANTTIECDNDPNPNQYPNCSAGSSNNPTHWQYITGRPSSLNSDHRYNNTDLSSDVYHWEFNHSSAPQAYVSVYINSRSFTGIADYSYETSGVVGRWPLNSLNQDTAPGGWNSIGQTLTQVNSPTKVFVEQWGTGDDIGADGAQLEI